MFPPVIQYFINILLALDQLANTLIGGWPDETMSSRFGKAKNCKLCNFICKLLDKIDPNHCNKAFIAELKDYQQPPENRGK